MKAFYCFCLISLLSLNVFAFKVSPIELNFSTTGSGSVQTMTVENTTKNSIPVEVFASERIHKNGKETRVPTEDFNYFPKQFILKPGAKRNIRISWMGVRPKVKNKKMMMKKGNTRISKEKAYRLKVQQVPVNLKVKKKTRTGISFLYNYVASLYVTPDKAKPVLKVLNYKKLSGTLLELNVMNVGGAHTIFAYQNLHVKSAGADPVVMGMKGQSDETRGVNLLAGETRKIRLKLPPGLLNKKGISFALKKNL